MAPTQLREHLVQRPFQPFRLYTTDGGTYDLRHPDMLLIGQDAAIVGMASDPNAIFFERTARIDLFHIVRIEPVSAPVTPSKGNGAGSESR